MDLSTAKPVRRFSRWALAALLGVVLLLAAAPAALAAASAFTGGPIAADTPTVIANDHTVYAMRFSATGGSGGAFLLANTTYYIKIRLTPNADGSPAGVDNRGFNWNPAATGSWVQERAVWENFTTVTTDGTGAITPQSQWLYFKFGDTTKAGTYRILVSLSVGGTGATRNGNVTIPVTVIHPAATQDPVTGEVIEPANSAWVHDGVSTGQVGKRASVVDHATPGNPIGLQRTEANSCDDDGDSVIDNETYGPVQAGGFRMAVPTGQALDAMLQSSIWPALSTGFTITTPDTDIALGAADQTAPSAPGTLMVEPRNIGTHLSWGAATDDTGVTAYNVYRWTATPAGEGYTANPVKVATVTDGTTFNDSGRTNGTEYFYLVRAVDAATNVGPRSNTASATPDGTPPASVALVATPGDGHVALAWNLPTDTDFAGVKILRKAGSAPTGVDDAGADVVYDGTGTTTDDTGVADGTHYYYAAYAYDTALNYATGGTDDATPVAVTTLTLSAAPKTVAWGAPWMLSGDLSDGGGAVVDASVDLEQSADGGGTWTLVEALTPATGTGTYDMVIPAPLQKTQYRLVYAGDAGHAAAQSTPTTVTPRVKLGKPVAPSVVSKRHLFKVYGALTPRQTAGSKTVKIKCYVKRNGAWMYKTTHAATNENYGAASRYHAGFSLPSAGAWKLVAVSAATAKYAATTSAAEFLKVR